MIHKIDRIQLDIRKVIEQLRLSNAYFSEITMQHIGSVDRGLLEVTRNETSLTYASDTFKRVLPSLKIEV